MQCGLPSAARVACLFVLLGLICQASAVRELKATIVIKQGVKPFSTSTTIVCHKGLPHAYINKVYTPVVWYNGWFPLTAVVNVKLLAPDARSCTRIKTVNPVVGPTVTKVTHTTVVG